MNDSRLVSRLLVLGIVVTLVMPTALAHGANTFSFIMRNETVQPGTAQVLQNDTLILYNTADYNRTVLLDVNDDARRNSTVSLGQVTPQGLLTSVIFGSTRLIGVRVITKLESSLMEHCGIQSQSMYNWTIIQKLCLLMDLSSNQNPVRLKRQDWRGYSLVQPSF